MFGVVEAIVTLMYSVYLPSCFVLQGGKPRKRESRTAWNNGGEVARKGRLSDRADFHQRKERGDEMASQQGGGGGA